jgi:hypothetical protein
MFSRTRTSLLIAAACLAYAAALFLLTDGYAIDDTWIHLQFARNVSSGLGPRFMPDQPPVYACSSPAWVFLLAAPYAAGVGGIASARLLSSLFAGLSIWLLSEALGRRGFSLRGRMAGAAILAVNPWMIRWGSSGMEASAAAAVVTAILLVLSRPGPRWLPAGLLSGLAFLVRPELAIAGPLCAVAMATRREPGRFRRGLLVLSSWGVVVAAWELAACQVFGRLTPSAASAKASASGFFSYLAGALPELAKSLAASDAAMLAAVLIAALAARHSLRPRLPGSAAQAFSAMILAALPLILLAGRAPIISRYLLPLSPCITALGLSALAGPGAMRRTSPSRIFVPAAIVLSLSSGLLFVYPHMRIAAANLPLYKDIAFYMRDSLPEGSVIAVQEIGIFEYYGGKDLLDLGGLVSPQVSASSFPGLAREAMRSIEFLRREGVTHYLDPHGVVPPLRGASGRTRLGFVPLREWTFGGGTALAGRGTYTRVLYRLEWL